MGKHLTYVGCPAPVLMAQRCHPTWESPAPLWQPSNPHLVSSCHQARPWQVPSEHKSSAVSHWKGPSWALQVGDRTSLVGSTTSASRHSLPHAPGGPLTEKHPSGQAAPAPSEVCHMTKLAYCPAPGQPCPDALGPGPSCPSTALGSHTF